MTNTNSTTANERQTLLEINSRFEDAKNYRLPLESKWYTNAAFLFGNQWNKYDPINKTFEETKSPSWRQKVIANMIFPTIRQIVSKLIRQDLSILAMPIPKTEDAKTKARIATKTIKHVFSKNDMASQLAPQIALYVLTFGVAYVKTFFDAKEYADMPVKEEENNRVPQILYKEMDAIADLEGKDDITQLLATGGDTDPLKLTAGNLPPLDLGDIYSSHAAQIGDICLEVLRPDFVYLDPVATSEKDARYAFIVKVRSKEYIYDRYGIEVEEKDVINVSNSSFNIDSILRKEATRTVKGALVKEYWERKNYKYPSGRHVVIANDKVVKDDINPYSEISDQTLGIPITSFNYFPTLGNLYTTSLVEQLVPLQKEYNRLRSDVVEHERVMMRGKWLVPTTANVPQTAITSQPGEKIYYDPRGGAPVAIPGTPPPAELWQHIINVKNEFNDIAGIHEVSRGRVPSGVRAASGIMFLQEQDDMQLSVTNLLFNDGFLDIANKIIKLASKYYIEDRLLKIVGKGSDYEVAIFKGGQQIDDNDLILNIEFGSKIPYSYVARQQFILSLADRGLITDRSKLLKMLEFPTEDDIYESAEYDEINARIENENMAQGTMVVVQDYDDHLKHLSVHDNYRKNPDFKKLPQQIQQIFYTHVEYHRRFIALMMASQQQQQENAPGANKDKQTKQPTK